MKSSKRKRVGTEESLSSMTSLASKWPLSNATNIMAPPTSSNYQQQMINGLLLVFILNILDIEFTVVPVTCYFNWQL